MKQVVDEAARSSQDEQSSLVPFTGFFEVVSMRIVDEKCDGGFTCSCSPPAPLVGRGPPSLCLNAGHSIPGQN